MTSWRHLVNTSTLVRSERLDLLCVIHNCLVLIDFENIFFNLLDFSKIIENGSFGIMYAGMMRNDLTMEWSTVAVKTGKTERDENLMLESILTELKILASLPKSHEYIRNLKGAYTKLLHKRM